MSQDVLMAAEVVQAGALVGGSNPASVSVATAISTTIPIVGRVMRISASAATTSGSCTLAKGTIDGQTVILVNESANNILISGNLLKAVETVSATRAGQFIWVATDTTWAAIC